MFYSDAQFGIHMGMSHTRETKQAVGSIGKRGMAPPSLSTPGSQGTLL